MGSFDVHPCKLKAIVIVMSSEEYKYTQSSLKLTVLAAHFIISICNPYSLYCTTIALM
jgi:hypothetical protein